MTTQNKTEGAATSRKPKRKPAKKPAKKKPSTSAELRYVSIASIDANPWRDLERFPYLDGKLATLVASIDDVGFWEGIIAREVGDRYQIAFGHHRIEAARRCKLDTVPIIVRELSDEQMIMFLGRENLTDYDSDSRTLQATWASGAAYLKSQNIEPTPTAIARIIGWVGEATGPRGQHKKHHSRAGATISGSVRDSHAAQACMATDKLLKLGVIREQDLAGVKPRAVEVSAPTIFRELDVIEKAPTKREREMRFSQLCTAYQSALQDHGEGKLASNAVLRETHKRIPSKAKGLPTFAKFVKGLSKRASAMGGQDFTADFAEVLEAAPNLSDDAELQELLAALTGSIDRLTRLREQLCEKFDIGKSATVIEINEARSALGRGR
jgi:hypothetical protein